MNLNSIFWLLANQRLLTQPLGQARKGNEIHALARHNLDHPISSSYLYLLICEDGPRACKRNRTQFLDRHKYKEKREIRSRLCAVVCVSAEAINAQRSISLTRN